MKYKLLDDLYNAGYTDCREERSRNPRESEEWDALLAYIDELNDDLSYYQRRSDIQANIENPCGWK